PVHKPSPPPRPYESPVLQPRTSSRPYESPVPQPSTSSRAFSPPPLSPTSKVTVVSQHVDTPPISNKAAVPYKPFKGRRVSGERAKTVTVQAGDIPRIIPGRRSSSSEYPLKATVRRSSSLEYPKSHVQASDAHLKHAVTVIKESQVPQKVKTVMMTDRPLDYPYKAEQPGQVLPSWKQELIERQKTHRYVPRDLGTPDQTMSSGSQSNKENEPRIVTQVEPLWMRELAEKRRNIYNRTQSNGDIQFERIETFERFEKPARSEDSEEEVREKPSFMKEFERKRRSKGRGQQSSEHGYHSSNSSYV
ncbi:uncharacterized protein LOC116288152, partial [Actinia tenebrosa]|uniref:Uncharacterized protein LOC116288152 n=1 Tax=Actinia tenebrosa TaxID=6105 RepID=A0A6P8HDV8_ACTTE